MKVFVLQALLEAVVAGDKDLGDSRDLTATDQVTGSGVLKVMSVGTRLTLLDLATLMICVSDNSATNMLIDELSIERIRSSVESNGWTDTSLSGKLQQAPVVGGTKRSPTVTSPRDLADYFGRLWSGDLLPPELTEVAIRIYRKQQFGELGRTIGYDQYSAEIGVSDLVIASKSGSIRGVRNDAGVIERALPDGTDTTVIAVMTDGCADLRFHAENLGARVVGDVSAAVLEHLGLPA
jgi:beta-lactamase class A